MSMIRVSGLTFHYPGSYDNIFEDVSFQIDTDWRLGFVGRNGRGKTTFLRLLMGLEEYEGSILTDGDFAYFPFSIRDKRALAYDVAEEICGGFDDWRLFREMNLLNMDAEALYQPFDTLSAGQQAKFMLAVLFLRERGFLLIDEPTNHLDAEARALVASYLKGKKSFILVSHDRTLLDGCIDHVMAINRCNIEIQKGNFSTWFQEKEARDRLEIAENQRLKGEISRLKKAAQQTEDWSRQAEKAKKGSKNAGLKPDRGYLGHKAAKMMQRSKSIESRRTSAIEEKSKLMKNIERTEALKLTPLAYHKEILASLGDVSIFYGEKTACQHVNLQVRQGERIQLKGKNGSGKSSVLKLLCGEDVRYSGLAELGSGLKISYVAQDTSFLQGSLGDFSREYGLDESLLKAILRKLDFDRIQFEKPMENFSQGQKNKVLLAKSLSQQAHLYLWDEPLNYLDVFSRIQIEEILLKSKPTMVFVEHDETFGEKIATRTMEL